MDGFFKHETCLRHRTFEGVDQKQNTVGHIQDTFNLTAEIAVAWSIYNVYFHIFITHRYVFRQDGDTSFTLQVVVIQNQFPIILILSEKL